MNKTEIEWTDYTWNPITGCDNSCSYCFARRIATHFKGSKAFPHGFAPTFHPERLDEILSKKVKPGTKIFTVDMGELFATGHEGWTFAVLNAIAGRPDVTFQLLTKHIILDKIIAQRIQEISVEDIIKEGLSTTLREHDACYDLKKQWITLWDSINGKTYPWSMNPWVFGLYYRVVKKEGK